MIFKSYMMPAMKKPCPAPDLPIQVTVCPTGCFHVRLGPAVLTMSGASARTLTRALGDALDAVAAPRPRLN